MGKGWEVWLVAPAQPEFGLWSSKLCQGESLTFHMSMVNVVRRADLVGKADFDKKGWVWIEMLDLIRRAEFTAGEKQWENIPVVLWTHTGGRDILFPGLWSCKTNSLQLVSERGSAAGQRAGQGWVCFSAADKGCVQECLTPHCRTGGGGLELLGDFPVLWEKGVLSWGFEEREGRKRDTTSSHFGMVRAQAGVYTGAWVAETVLWCGVNSTEHIWRRHFSSIHLGFAF